MFRNRLNLEEGAGIAPIMGKMEGVEEVAEEISTNFWMVFRLLILKGLIPHLKLKK